MRVYEAIAKQLKLQGVEAVFTLMSEETAKLLIELSRAGITVYGSRHEAGAVGMADGYSRISRTLGVAIIGRGPGFTNSLTALVTASRAMTPLLVIVGASAVGVEDPGRVASGAKELKHLDQEAMLEGANVFRTTLTKPQSICADLRALVDQARTGTVVINLPTDVVAVEAGDSPVESLTPLPTTRLSPDPADIRLVADLLEAVWAAQHPVILAGRGATKSDARDELIRLGELTGSLLATTLYANSLFVADPYNIGIVGSFSTPTTLELLAGADLLLVFGASLSNFTTYGGDLFARKRVIQFDSNPAAFGRHFEPELGVLGDARESARALADELTNRHHRSVGYRTAEISLRIPDCSVPEAFSDASRPGALDPRTLMLAIDEILPKERNLVVDPGHHLNFSAAHISVPDPTAFIVTNDFSAIGTATGVALGAALASPDRLTVLAIGDGAFMMSIADVHTAVRYHLPVIFLIVNDAAFGAEVHYLQVSGQPDELALLQNPSFETVALGLGLRALTVSTLDDLSRFKAELSTGTGPLLVDCKVNRDVRAESIGFYYLGNRRAQAGGSS